MLSLRPSTKFPAFATSSLLLATALSVTVGCGQPTTFGGAYEIPTSDAQGSTSVPVSKKGLVEPEATPKVTVQGEETRSKLTAPAVQPLSAEIEGGPSNSAAVNESESKPKPAPSAEAEIADTPMPVAGAFLTCWTGIHPAVGDGAADAKGKTKIGCGLITSTGQRSSVVIPMDQWRIYSNAGVVLDSLIPGLKTAAAGAVWSVEFELPTMDVEQTRIAIRNDLVGVFPGAGKFVITSLSLAKKVGGAENPTYFHLGAMTTILSDCDPAAIAAASSRPADREMFVPLKISATSGLSSTATFVVKVLGLCGIGGGNRPPSLVVTSLTSPGPLPLPQPLLTGDTTVEVSLPPGDYELVVKPTPIGWGNLDNIVVRDFLVVPISSNGTAGGIGVR